MINRKGQYGEMGRREKGSREQGENRLNKERCRGGRDELGRYTGR